MALFLRAFFYHDRPAIMIKKEVNPRRAHVIWRGIETAADN